MSASGRGPLTGLTAAILLVAAAAFGQPLPNTVPNDSWGPSGDVYAVAREGDTLYVGGSFRYVGPGTGPLAVFAIDGADPAAIAQDWHGSVDRLLTMPDGGWVVAGVLYGPDANFRRLARIDPQGRLDSDWHVDVIGTVEALATDGSRVFLGGTFFELNGATRTGLAAVDVATGAVLGWNPVLADAALPRVEALAVHQSSLFVGGTFTSVNGTSRVSFAALDTATAALQPLQQSTLATVHDLALAGDTLYLAGRLPSFSNGGIALSVSTGQPLAWSMPASVGEARIVATPSRVFAADFATLRALDPVTGASIGPPLISDASISALAAADGIVAVAVTEFSDGFSPRVRTFDSATGHPRGWSLRLDQSAAALAVRNGLLSIGGSFQSAGGVTRRNLFALNLHTGRPTAFAPDIDGEVNALTTVGQVVVAGGSFREINGNEHRALVALAADSAAALSWAPIRDGVVRTLALHAGTIFVGGEFEVVDGVSRPNLAAIQLAAGTVSTWLPVPDGTVRALAAAGDSLLAVGDFSTTAAGGRGFGASFSATTGTLGPFDPRADGTIGGVAAAGGAVALVGSFSSLGGQTRRDFGIVDSTGTALPLSLPFQTFGARSVAGLGSQFIVGGLFVGPTSRALFAVSTQFGLLPWNPEFDSAFSFPEVTVLARYQDVLVAGGRFSGVGGRRLLNLALFPTAGAGPPTALRARVVGTQASLGWAPPAGTVPTSYVVEAGTSTGASNAGRFSVASPGIGGSLAAGTYYVRVRAVVGGVEGQVSSEVVLTIPAVATAPAAPAGLVASTGPGAVSLAWVAATGNAESYIIEAGTSPGQSNLAAFDTGVLDTHFSASVGAGTYYVRIRARNPSGAGGASNEVQVVVP
jgi:hypothetical protein